jgi:hypothetical protein
MHTKTLALTLNTPGRKKEEIEPWRYTTTKMNPRCERCDGSVDKGEKLCHICRRIKKDKDSSVSNGNKEKPKATDEK